MAKGIALAIGLNSVDPHHYAGWSGPLTACEADARDMVAIAKSNGFTATAMMTKEATRGAVQAAIAGAAKKLGDGDMFMLSYSGHGGQLPDHNNDEPDALDETWCLYDGEWVDDQIFDALGAFPQGVRVLVFSDSCHSGSVIKLTHYAAAATTTAFRNMPLDVAFRTYEANRESYDKVLGDQDLAKAQQRVKASTLLISGCQDNQLSADGAFNGRFTGMLKRVWNGGKFKGDYRAFHRAIGKLMPPDQTPNFFTVGPSDKKFLGQKPFKI